jgi:hypothetical protein
LDYKRFSPPHLSPRPKHEVWYIDNFFIYILLKLSIRRYKSLLKIYKK